MATLTCVGLGDRSTDARRGRSIYSKAGTGARGRGDTAVSRVVWCGARTTSYICMDLRSGGDANMHLILPESDRPLLQASEYATLSIVAHAVAAWFVLSPTANTFRLPTEERDARAMFLLPPDPVNAATREADIPLPA